MFLVLTLFILWNKMSPNQVLDIINTVKNFCLTSESDLWVKSTSMKGWPACGVLEELELKSTRPLTVVWVEAELCKNQCVQYLI